MGVCELVAMHWILAPEPACAVNPVSLVEDLLCSEHFVGPNKIVWLRKAMQLTPDTIHQVAALTEGQSSNVMWSAVRKLRFTASLFGDLLRAVSSGK